MEAKIAALPFAKATNIQYLIDLDAQLSERGGVSYRRHYDIAVIVETNETSIKKMVSIGCKQKTILTVQPLVVC